MRSTLYGGLVLISLTVGAVAQPVTPPSSGGGATPSGSSGDIQTYATSTTLGHITPGTGIATALSVNVGTAGSLVVNGGALGTPASGVGTNLTGTASGLTAGNASALGGATFAAPGAIGGGTPGSGAFTTLSGTSVSINGTAGAGFVHLSPQSSAPATPTTGLQLSAGPSNGYFLYITNKDGFIAEIDTTALTANRSYILPDVNGGRFITNADTATVTNTMLAGSIDLSTKMTGTLTNDSVGPTPWASGSGSISVTTTRSYTECTSTCTVTLPAPVSGAEHCVRNANNVSTVITLAGIASVQFEVQAKTSYKSANTSIVSDGAVTNTVCYVGNGTTKYDWGTMIGTWT